MAVSKQARCSLSYIVVSLTTWSDVLSGISYIEV